MGILTIPETIRRLVAVETIKINACIGELSIAISKLNNLKLLDLSGCYHLLSIPEEVFEMKDLKSKIGEVVFIPVPLTGITQEAFSKTMSVNKKKIEKLIIRLVSPPDEEEEPEAFDVPDEIKELTERKRFSITGNLSSLPLWIGNMNTLCSLILNCSSLESLSSSIGDFCNLTSLNLGDCYLLVSLPSSIGNLSHPTSLDLSGCNNLTSIPTSLFLLNYPSQASRENCWNTSYPIRYGLE